MKKDYKFNNSTVTIKFGSVLESNAEVIVSSGSCNMTMNGILNRLIREKGGDEIYNDVKKHLPAKLGHVIVTSAGNLPQKHLFHAITLDKTLVWNEMGETKITETFKYIVGNSVRQCLRLLSVLELKSIAFPSIGTGGAGIPYEVSAECMAEAMADILFSTNASFDVEIYLYDNKMSEMDFLPFFEWFSRKSYYGGIERRKMDLSIPIDTNIEVYDYKIAQNHQVFISYARKNLEIVKGICGMLNKEQIPYWIDVDGNYSGEDYKMKIVEAIDKARIVLFISSAESNASPNVIREIGIASGKGKVIIPVKIDESGFAPSIQYDISNIDYIDYTAQDEVALNKLKQAVLGKLFMEKGK